MTYYYARLNRAHTKSLLTVELPFGMNGEQAEQWIEDKYNCGIEEDKKWFIVGLSEDNPDGSDGMLAGVR